MRNFVLIPALILSVIVLMSGCEGADPKSEIARIKKEKDMIHTEYRGYIQRIKQKTDALQSENAKLKQGGGHRVAVDRMAELSGIRGVKWRDGEIVVVMTASILFDPGSARLKNSAKSILSKLSSALNDPIFAGKAVRIEGHTDSDPIKRTKKYSSNWSLASARAQSVLEYMTKYGGIDPSKRTIYTASFSKYHPVTTDKGKSGKAQNRRVEVVVIMGK